MTFSVFYKFNVLLMHVILYRYLLFAHGRNIANVHVIFNRLIEH